MSQCWFSYDEVAAAYAACAEPLYFAGPAQDLIALLQLQPGDRALDLGAGSGAVTKAARRIASAVIACDVSLPMLLTTEAPRVAGALPRLPFRTKSYSAATLGFVLSHLPDPVDALLEVARVLVRGGRVGVSAWASSVAASPPGELWQKHTRRFIDDDELAAAVARVIPAETRLSSLTDLRAVLNDANFESLVLESREYEVRVPVEKFIGSRLLSASSRYMIARLSHEDWARFLADVTDALREAFGEQVALTTRVNLARGTTSR